MKDVILRPLYTKDIPQLAEFLSTFPDDTRSRENWQQRLTNWWVENSAYSSDAARDHREVIVGFGLEEFTVIKGCTCNIRTRMLWQGKEISVVNGTTWRVLPEYRKYSMDLWFAHRDETAGSVYFNTTPTPDVQKLLKRMGFVNYGFAGDTFYFVNKPASLNINPVLKALIARFMRAVKMNLINIGKKQTDIVVRQVKADDIAQELDDLWSETKCLYQYTNVRDSAAIRWFCYNKMLYGIWLNGKLKGYFITVTDNDSVYLADIWGLEMESWFKKALSYIVKDNPDASRLIFPTYLKWMEQVYKKIGLLPRRNTANPAFMQYDRKQQPYDEAAAYLTLLQGDFGA